MLSVVVFACTLHTSISSFSRVPSSTRHSLSFDGDTRRRCTVAASVISVRCLQINDHLTCLFDSLNNNSQDLLGGIATKKCGDQWWESASALLLLCIQYLRRTWSLVCLSTDTPACKSMITKRVRNKKDAWNAVPAAIPVCFRHSLHFHATVRCPRSSLPRLRRRQIKEESSGDSHDLIHESHGSCFASCISYHYVVSVWFAVLTVCASWVTDDVSASCLTVTCPVLHSICTAPSPLAPVFS